MTQNEVKKHFQEQLQNFQGVHAEAMKTMIKLFDKIEQLQENYRKNHSESSYWKGVKEILDELEKAYEE